MRLGDGVEGILKHCLIGWRQVGEGSKQLPIGRHATSKQLSTQNLGSMELSGIGFDSARCHPGLDQVTGATASGSGGCTAESRAVREQSLENRG